MGTVPADPADRDRRDERADDRWYRTRRFLRRHRAAAALAVLIVVALSAGLFIVNRERAVAERRFQQVRRLANQVLALDAVMRELSGATRARQQIVAISKEYLEGLEREAGGDPELSLELGTAYLKLARAQGVPNQTNLGMHEEAGRSLTKAESLVQSVVRASRGHARAQLTLAEIDQDLMILADTNRRDDAALARARETADRVETFLTLRAAPDTQEQEIVGMLLNNVALLHKNQHRYDESIRIAQRARDARPESDVEGRGNAWSLIADARRLSGDLPGAFEAITHARRAMTGVSTDSTISAINHYNVLWREGVILGGDGQISLERPDEAAAALQRAFDVIEGVAAKDPNDALARIRFSTSARELGAILRRDQPARALQVYEHARRLREVGNNARARRGEAQILAASTYVLRRMDRTGEARERIDRSVQILRDIHTYPAAQVALGDEVDSVLRAWADHVAETGDADRAAGGGSVCGVLPIPELKLNA